MEGGGGGGVLALLISIVSDYGAKIKGLNRVLGWAATVFDG